MVERLAPDDAATAATWGGKPAPKRARILRVVPYRNSSGTMRALFSCELPSGLRLHSCKLMCGPNGTYWIGTPDQKQRTPDDRVMPGADGKPLWHQLVEFKDRQTRDKFNRLVLDALRRSNPELFDGEEQ